MKRALTPEERKLLVLRHKREKKRTVCDRIKAVLLHDEGYSYSEISRILLLDDETIRRHVAEYFNKNKLKGESGGSHSQLSIGQSSLLCLHLNEVTYLYVKQICNYVLRTFKVKYSISGMTQWLHRNKFRYKKPQPTPGKVNSTAQKAFIEYYEKLKAACSKNTPIYCRRQCSSTTSDTNNERLDPKRCQEKHSNDRQTKTLKLYGWYLLE